MICVKSDHTKPAGSVFALSPIAESASHHFLDVIYVRFLQENVSSEQLRGVFEVIGIPVSARHTMQFLSM